MKYHVTYEMMDRELRFSGKLIRTICPVMTESTYGMVNRGYRLFLKGKWKSEQTDCAFREIPREDGMESAGHEGCGRQRVPAVCRDRQ